MVERSDGFLPTGSESAVAAPVLRRQVSLEERRAALARIGSIAAVAPLMAIMLRPDPARAQSGKSCTLQQNEDGTNCGPSGGSSGGLSVDPIGSTSLSEATSFGTSTSLTDPTSTSLGISTSVDGGTN
ncbi:MAG: hypothetical protein RQ752_13795 [Thermohalobaculum sp.]|nr:hypothetical protein [Thermohalobaculum sp.]